MGNTRNLLARGTSKLSESIYHFSIPAIDTCPGKTRVCSEACYATKGRFLGHSVASRHAWCHEQSLREDFVRLMVEEVKGRGVLVVRIHSAGDLYSADYARKWVQVAQRCRRTKFFLYTRSYRAPEVEPALWELAAQKNVSLWYSTDAETGIPERIPPRVRLAYLQHDERTPEYADLAFRTRKMRSKPRVGLPMVCPQETNPKVNCGNCHSCFS